MFNSQLQERKNGTSPMDHIILIFLKLTRASGIVYNFHNEFPVGLQLKHALK